MSFTEEFLDQEIRRTKPDYVIYRPHGDDEHQDHGNEHLHVFRARDNRLCALWTMSSFEATPTQRAVMSFSFDDGKTWTAPKEIPHDPIDPETGLNMISWTAQAVSKSGRIYVISNRKIPSSSSALEGDISIRFSDDCGETWSEEAVRKFPQTKLDDPDFAPDWCVWQGACRLQSGAVLMGFSRGWHGKQIPERPHPDVWMEHPCGCEFFRIDNLDEDPAPDRLQLTFLGDPDHPLTAPLRDHPDHFCAEEPAVCQLPDGRLFCVMRTVEGHVWYSLSSDDGRTWAPSEMLRYRDGGEGILHPLSPSPMFPIGNGEYLLFVHGHDGFFGKEIPMVKGNWRNPLQMIRGEFRPGARQPVWFSRPVEIMNNGDVAIARKDLAMYCDMTIENGDPVLWYPDRKFFLLGRRFPRTMLNSMKIEQ